LVTVRLFVDGGGLSGITFAAGRGSGGGNGWLPCGGALFWVQLKPQVMMNASAAVIEAGNVSLLCFIMAERFVP